MLQIGDSVILNDFGKTGRVVFTYYQNSIKHQRCHVVDEDGVEHLNLLSARLKKLGGSTMTHEELQNLTVPELNTVLRNRYTPNQLKNVKKVDLINEVLNNIKEKINKKKKPKEKIDKLQLLIDTKSKIKELIGIEPEIKNSKGAPYYLSFKNEKSIFIIPRNDSKFTIIKGSEKKIVNVITEDLLSRN